MLSQNFCVRSPFSSAFVSTKIQFYHENKGRYSEKQNIYLGGLVRECLKYLEILESERLQSCNQNYVQYANLSDGFSKIRKQLMKMFCISVTKFLVS